MSMSVKKAILDLRGDATGYKVMDSVELNVRQAIDEKVGDVPNHKVCNRFYDGSFGDAVDEVLDFVDAAIADEVA